MSALTNRRRWLLQIQTEADIDAKARKYLSGSGLGQMTGNENELARLVFRTLFGCTMAKASGWRRNGIMLAAGYSVQGPNKGNFFIQCYKAGRQSVTGRNLVYTGKSRAECIEWIKEREGANAWASPEQIKAFLANRLKERRATVSRIVKAFNDCGRQFNKMDRKLYALALEISGPAAEIRECMRSILPESCNSSAEFTNADFYALLRAVDVSEERAALARSSTILNPRQHARAA